MVLTSLVYCYFLLLSGYVVHPKKETSLLSGRIFFQNLVLCQLGHVWNCWVYQKQVSKFYYRVDKVFLCHAYRLSPSNQVSHTIFDNPISLKWREEIKTEGERERERELNFFIFWRYSEKSINREKYNRLYNERKTKRKTRTFSLPKWRKNPAYWAF